MPSSELMNSVVNKLLNRPNKIAPLIFNSEAANIKTNELKTRIVNYQLSETSYIIIGTFLQNIELNIFTDSELFHLLSYNYESIQSSKILPNNYNYNFKKPLYDLDNKLINAPYSLSFDIQNNFIRLQGINRILNLEYLANYLIAQL